MRIIFALGHPAHYHLFKNTISRLIAKDVKIKILISDKDILKKLLEDCNFDYSIIAPKRARETLTSKALKVFKTTFTVYKIVKRFKPSLMIGSLTQPAYVSLLTGIPYVFTGEDDISYTMLQCAVTYPFVSHILAPKPTKVGVFSYKKIPYAGYQKLAYLHPKVFSPEKTHIKQIDFSLPYYVIRLVNMKAYHDLNVKGFSDNVLDRLIKMLEKHGRVYISSENVLASRFNKYKMPTKTMDIHHLLFFADIYIGDSQSMAVEAAVLGTPSVRYNDFVGKISVLEELEKKYGLTVGVKTSDTMKLFETVNDLIADQQSKNNFRERQKIMLKDKINVTDFFVWFIENYPKSAKVMRENPDYQNTFK